MYIHMCILYVYRPTRIERNACSYSMLRLKSCPLRFASPGAEMGFVCPWPGDGAALVTCDFKLGAGQEVVTTHWSTHRDHTFPSKSPVEIIITMIIWLINRDICRKLATLFLIMTA